MAKISIPQTGDWLAGNAPQPLRIAKCRVSYNDATADVSLPTAVQASIVLFTVAAGTIVHDMYAVLDQSSMTSTASGTFKLGDSASNSGWLASSDIVGKAKGTVSRCSVIGRVNKNGKLYSAATDIKFTNATGRASKCNMLVVMEYTNTQK